MRDTDVESLFSPHMIKVVDKPGKCSTTVWTMWLLHLDLLDVGAEKLFAFLAALLGHGLVPFAVLSIVPFGRVLHAALTSCLPPCVLGVGPVEVFGRQILTTTLSALHGYSVP